MTPPRQFGDRRGRPHPDWIVKAACRGRADIDLNDFHPEFKQDYKAATARAKRVCAPCPVRDECREFGDLISPHDGIWGGLLPSERAARRAHRRSAA